MGPFLGGTVFFIFVFMMAQALRLADFFINRGVGGAMLGKLSALDGSFVPADGPADGFFDLGAHRLRPAVGR